MIFNSAFLVGNPGRAAETLARMRQLLVAADPEIEQEWKWKKPNSGGLPVWSHDGIVCTGETYKQVMKLTFARGASVDDLKELFNSSVEDNVRRFPEGVVPAEKADPPPLAKDDKTKGRRRTIGAGECFQRGTWLGVSGGG